MNLGLMGQSILAGVASAFGADESQAAPARPQQACTAPDHRQFDFWAGSWQVYRTGESILVAHSVIEELHDGCVIREHWMPLKGGGGSSLSHFDVAQRRWHQTWIDYSNTRVEFNGGMVGGKMVLTGFWKNANGPGKHGLVQMTYSKNNDGTLRQLGGISTDHGVSWSPFFDFTYRPRK